MNSVLLILSFVVVHAETNVAVSHRDCPPSMVFHRILRKCCSKCPKKEVISPCTNTSDTVCGKLSLAPSKFLMMLQQANSEKINSSQTDRSIEAPDPEDKTASLLDIVLSFTSCVVFIIVTSTIVSYCLRRRLIRNKNLQQCPVAMSPRDGPTAGSADTAVMYVDDSNQQRRLYLSDDYVNPCDLTMALLQIRNKEPAADSDSTSLASSTEIVDDYNTLEVLTGSASHVVGEPSDSNLPHTATNQRTLLLNGSCNGSVPLDRSSTDWPISDKSTSAHYVTGSGPTGQLEAISECVE